MASISCQNVQKRFDSFWLQGIDFSVEPGYVTGLIGRNGTGKTTLMRLMMGSYLPDGGDIRLDGLSAQENARAYKKQFAYVLNETPFGTAMTSWECGVLYGAYYDGFDREKYRRLLKEYDVPEKKMLHKLSKGQQIRQQLAFALSYEANVYFLDEPAGNLDVVFRDAFYENIRQLTASGEKTVIYAGHLVDEMERLADYILWLDTVRSREENKEDTAKEIQKSGQRFFGTLDELREGYQLIELSEEELLAMPGVTVCEEEELLAMPASDVCGEDKSLDKEREDPFMKDTKKIMIKTADGQQTVFAVGSRERKLHQEMLVKTARENLPEQIRKYSRYATIKEIMYYTSLGKQHFR